MVYRFDHYELDTQRYELRRLGMPVKVEPQALRVLAYLVQHCDRVVAKHELAEHIWRQTCASDEAMTRALRVVRQALGDSGRTQQFIRTVYGSGYRFVATPVEVDERSPYAPHLTPRPALHWENASAQTLAPHLEWPDAASIGLAWKPITALACAIDQVATEARDPESQEALLYTFFPLVHQQVQQYGGYFQSRRRDGFLALFGMSVPCEDHARRALQVAMTLQRHLRTLQCHPRSDETVALRIGIHTGPMMEEPAHREPHDISACCGDVSQYALALQQGARPGSICVSAATASQVQNTVRLQALEPARCLGEASQHAVYTVRAARVRQATLDWHTTRPRRAFVGRQIELRQLHLALDRSMSGHGQIVNIVSEPGMGKTRLLREFRRSLRGRDVVYVQGHCSPYAHPTRYSLVREIVWQLCGIRERDVTEVRLQKLEKMLGALHLTTALGAQGLLQLLDRSAESGTDLDSNAEASTAQALELVHQLCRHGSQHKPLVIAVENVHQIDPASQGVLQMLVNLVAGAPILLLTTYRLDYQPQWLTKSYTTHLVLAPLTFDESLRLIGTVEGAPALPSQTVQDILQRANGNPLFLEALTCAAGPKSHSQKAFVPDVIQNILMARLGQLPAAERHLLQTAAVLGTRWPRRLLETFWNGATPLEPLLWKLQRAELLYEYPATEPSYAFRSTLMQEVVYHSLIPERRQVLQAALHS